MPFVLNLVMDDMHVHNWMYEHLKVQYDNGQGHVMHC